MSVKMEGLSLHVADYCVFLGMVLLCTGIGVAYGVGAKGASTKEAFFLGNRSMSSLPVAISLMVTFQSAIMMLGTPAEVYIYGTSVLLMEVGFFASQLMAVIITVPLFRPLKLTSVYEYLQLRFNSRPVRLCGVILNIITNLIYSGIVIYAPAVALQAVTGFNQWITIATLAVSGVLFTVMGGIKSVVWTDVFQGIVMFLGILLIIGKATYAAGGFGKVWEIAAQGRRLDTFNFNPDPTVRHTVWTLCVPAFVRTFRHMFDQGTVQRVSAAKSDKGATLVMAIMAPLDLVLFTLVVLEGVVIYAYFQQQDVEPLSAGIISNPNQIVPYAVLVLFQDYPGLPGLYLAAIFAASLSTLSSSLSTMSIILMEDILQPVIKNMSDSRQLTLAKFSVVLIGVTSCIFCAIANNIPGSLMQICISLLSATTGPSIGMFLLGCFFPSSTSKGVIMGLTTGSCLCWALVMGHYFAEGVSKTPWLPLGNQTFCGENNVTVFDDSENCVPTPEDFLRDRPFSIFNLSYNLTAMIGVFTTIGAGLIFSFIFGRNRPGDVDPAYLLPISNKWLLCLPRPLRRWIKKRGPQFQAGWHMKMKEGDAMLAFGNGQTDGNSIGTSAKEMDHGPANSHYQQNNRETSGRV